jgi:hypothetical protein
LFAAVLAAGPARAEDQIKIGKWEFHVQVAMPNMPKLPPSVQLPPGIQMGAGGISVTHTSCITDANPIPPDNRMPKPGDKNNQCKMAKMDRRGGSISWIMGCQSPQGTTHSEGDAHYDGDTMEATFKTRISQPGAPPESSQHVTGRYIGPCDK